MEVDVKWLCLWMTTFAGRSNSTKSNVAHTITNIRRTCYDYCMALWQST